MKKLFVLVALFTTVYINNANAQDKPAGDPSAMVDKIKEKLKPELMQKADLTEAEATRALDIHFTYAKRLRHFDNAPAAEKQKQTDVITAAENKELTAIPLTAEKIKAVNEFFAEQKKQMEKNKAAGAPVKANN
jgi:hypothetical protein